MYETLFLDLVSQAMGLRVLTASDDRYGLTLKVQTSEAMRFECHVDSNPVQGLLFCSDHPKGSGGELVVSNSEDAHSKEEVDANCARIYPALGHFMVFDGRKNAHYVNQVTADTSPRIVAAMNFYTLECPEETRDEAINEHLFQS